MSKILISNNVYPFVVKILGGMQFISVSSKIKSSPDTLIYVGKEVMVYKMADRRADFYIHDALYATQIDTFLNNGNISLYRGVPRWHKTWHTIEKSLPISSFGKGNYPDFNTRNTIYIPFTADLSIAQLAARSAKGMDARDRIEFVEGYSKSLTFPIGQVVRYDATSKDALGFFNYSEVQVAGPVNLYWQETIYRMGTNLGDVFPNARMTLTQEANEFMRTGMRNDMAQTMPDVPKKEEIQDYIKSYGSLIK